VDHIRKTSSLAHRPKYFSHPPLYGRSLRTAVQNAKLSQYRGLIGPARLFSKGSLYHPQVYALLIGAILPVILWLWVRRFPRSIIRNASVPVIFSGCLWLPPATGINYTSYILVGFVFQFWIRRRYFAWWSKVSVRRVYAMNSVKVGDRGPLVCSAASHDCAERHTTA
jgi:hypothetical protein